MLVGASNLWFPVTASVIVMPQSGPEEEAEWIASIRAALSADKLAKYVTDLDTLRAYLRFTVVRSVADARALLRAGADKVSVKCQSCQAISVFDPARQAQRCQFCVPASVPASIDPGPTPHSAQT